MHKNVGLLCICTIDAAVYVFQHTALHYIRISDHTVYQIACYSRRPRD